MSLLKRVKNIWDLSKKDPDKVEELLTKDIDALPDEGDSKAVFFGEGTQEEFGDMQREDKFGAKKLFGL